MSEYKLDLVEYEHVIEAETMEELIDQYVEYSQGQLRRGYDDLHHIAEFTGTSGNVKSLEISYDPKKVRNRDFVTGYRIWALNSPYVMSCDHMIEIFTRLDR